MAKNYLLFVVYCAQLLFFNGVSEHASPQQRKLTGPAPPFARNEMSLLEVTARPSEFSTPKPTTRVTEKEYPLQSGEYDGLYALYNATDGTNWVWRNVSDRSKPWNFSDPAINPCYDSWQGIDCLCALGTCTIQEISLSAHNLSGTLPIEIGVFERIVLLDLSNNTIRGTIPESIGNLTSLSILQLYNNLLIGSFPASIGHISHLRSLGLQANKLNGTLPEGIYLLTDLQSLQIEGNYISGTISPNITNLNQLIDLFIQLNEFSGTFPDIFENFTHLVNLDIDTNYFNGTIPRSIFTLSNLSTFIAGGNYFNGSLPNEIGTMKGLRLIDLTLNYLTGSLPPSLANLSNIEEFYLNSNKFIGSIPENFPCQTTSHMFSFDISANLLTGTIPATIKYWEFLQYFSIENNQFHGPFPWKEISYPRLLVFQIGSNMFDGLLPESTYFANITRIIDFNIALNLFSGNLPSGNWSKLSVYLSYGNYLTKTIPDTFYHSKLLAVFEINQNYISGSIPTLFGKMKLLSYMNMTSNLLTSSLDNLFSEGQCCPDLTQLALAYNFLTGTLPDSLSSLIYLHGIFLNNNGLTGVIPSTISLLSELEVLLLQNNNLTGELPPIFDSSLLANVDVSNNKLTGTLPTKFGENASLVTLSLGENCFQGSLPLELCSLRTIEVFSFNGLSTALECRKYLFPNSAYFHSYVLEYELDYPIPECLFSMPHIQTLHLSGNGLTGSLSSDLNISSSLTDLSLSHNQLSGSIPLSIQERGWTNLDLSYNKLDGHLSSNFHQYSDNATLALQINRLSGGIPSVLRNAKNINILEGNLFRCEISRNDVPKNDKKASDYSCGSDVANYTLYSWVTVFGFLLLLGGIGYSYYQRERKWRSKSKAADVSDIMSEVEWEEGRGKTLIGFIIRLIIWRREIHNTQLSEDSAILELTGFLHKVRFLSIVIGAIILFIYLPLFSTLGIYYSQYDNKYAWKVSGLLLTGVTPAIILEVFLFLFLLFIIFYFNRVFAYRDLDFLRTTASSFGGGSDLFRSSNNDRITRTAPTDKKLSSTLLVTTLLTVGILDFFFMIVVDLVYVYVIISYDTSIIIVSEILLALMKTFLNNVLLWRTIPTMKRLLHPCIDGNIIYDEEIFHYTKLDISFISVFTLLNNIIFPILAVFIISPDCFYTALFQPADVASSYTYTICDRYAGYFFVNYCFLYESLTEGSSYTPPFMYNYQCASTIFINYVTVFIIMFTAEGIIIPLLKLITKFIDEEDEVNEASKDNDSRSSQNGATLTKSLYTRESMGKSLQSRISSMLLPANLKSLSPLNAKNFEDNCLFDKNRLAVRLNAYLVVMFSYGALFPPLALIVCTTIFIVTMYEEIVIGRLLYESERLGFVWYKKQLERDCYGVSDSLKYTLWSLVPVSSLLFAYVIFDTWGDETGWQLALFPSLFMGLVPTILLIILKNHGRMKVLKRYFNQEDSLPAISQQEKINSTQSAENAVRSDESKDQPVLRPSEIEVTAIVNKSIDAAENPMIKDIENRKVQFNT